ncbi:MAG: hypothetical protein MUF09_10100 [Candidatus Nanopelagicales bacterium]|nr:hypothetical protein [Candidatus Nanopelagicales bacterium]
MTRPRTAHAPRHRPIPHPRSCPMSGKVRYRDAREATEALHVLLNRAALADELGGQHGIRVKRKYQCNACRGWHLTSQDTWNSPMEAQTAAMRSAAAVPGPRRPDPLLAALAGATGLLDRLRLAV